jgi:soluble lytic murein transglycosylase-like protein
MNKLNFIAGAVALAGLLANGGLARANSCASPVSGADRLEVESIIDDVAMIHSLDPSLLSAIARVESNECPDAVSPKGAAGLMQLTAATAAEFGVEDRFDPVQNALGAARFIDYLERNRPEGKLSLPEILAAYNAGEAAVARAGGVPHYRETEEYVRRVLWLYLVGHLPESERIRDAERHSGARPISATHSAPKRHFADNDSAILDQLSQLKEARRSEQASQSP